MNCRLGYINIHVSKEDIRSYSSHSETTVIWTQMSMLNVKIWYQIFGKAGLFFVKWVDDSLLFMCKY